VPRVKAKHANRVTKARVGQRRTPSGKRSRGAQRNDSLPFVPPETWHEPTEQQGDYHIVVQPPGDGYRHVVSPQEVRQRLAQLPKRFVAPLDVVQLSQMTRKKRTFPCYGMQWGTALYLYPIEDGLVEYFYQPPRPNLVNETKMYGGRWEHTAPSTWRLVWKESTIRDYYLNNILIHELGHLLDDRNESYQDRERFAEWFAIHHGYQPTQAARNKRLARSKRVRRRHHARVVA